MLMSGIKSGEQGWMDVLMARVSESPLPSFAGSADLVTAAPTAFHRRWMRGFDLAEEAARGIADRLGVPFRRTLRKDTWIRRQAGRTQSDRRKLAKKTIGALRKAAVGDKIILLVDDVWTTGTTLLRCAQALREAGASEVRVLTLFRAT
jgi:competence protein ComFC